MFKNMWTFVSFAAHHFYEQDHCQELPFNCKHDHMANFGYVIDLISQVRPTDVLKRLRHCRS